MRHLFKNKPLLALVIAQCSLIVVAFNQFFAHPMNFMFKSYGDALKNYYTLYNYVRPENESFTKFSFYNYPFGDYVFYTDNTPLFAFPIKVFSTYIFDLTPYVIPIFNLFCLITLLLSTILLYKILTRLITSPYLVFFFSLALVWLNPQTYRFFAGHANLGFSFPLLLNIWLLIRFFDQWPAHPTKAIRSLFYLFLTLVLSAFFHIYYIGIMGVFTALVFGAWGLSHIRQPKVFLGRSMFALVFASLSVGTVIAFIQSIDSYYDLRLSTPEGYDFLPWKTRPASLYSSFDYNTFVLPFSEYTELEARAYVSAFNFFGVGLFVLMMFLKETRSVILGGIRRMTKDAPWVWYMLFAGFFCLMIAFGHTIPWRKGTVFNYLNPFYYLSFFTDSFMQFRCIGRFSWFFYWGTSLPVIYLIHYVWQYTNRKLIHFVLLIILGLTALEAYDFIKYQNKKQYKNIFTNESKLGDAYALVDGVDPSDYQAILPFPYWHGSCEDYNYTIDPHSGFYAICSQLSIVSALPMMSSRISRTPFEHTKAVFSLFSDTMDPLLLENLDDRPILVFHDKKLTSDPSTVRTDQRFKPAATVARTGHEIIEKYKMEKIKEYGSYALYKWDLTTIKEQEIK